MKLGVFIRDEVGKIVGVADFNRVGLDVRFFEGENVGMKVVKALVGTGDGRFDGLIDLLLVEAIEDAVF